MGHERELASQNGSASNNNRPQRRRDKKTLFFFSLFFRSVGRKGKERALLPLMILDKTSRLNPLSLSLIPLPVRFSILVGIRVRTRTVPVHGFLKSVTERCGIPGRSARETPCAGSSDARERMGLFCGCVRYEYESLNRSIDRSE